MVYALIPITSTTRLYVLLGDPIEHSLSPIMHNSAFRSLRLNCIYLCLCVKSEALKKSIEGIKSLGICGFNVTIPHKVSTMKYLDEIDSLAKDIGAVNTVHHQDGVLIGYNTDGLGVLNAFEEEHITLKGKRVVILGAGGAARAVSFTIAPFVDSLVILNRTEDRATQLASNLRNRFENNVVGRKLNDKTLSNTLVDIDILINSTPVGMFPRVDDCLVDKRFIHSDMVVFDLVYNPIETRLLKEAKAVGAKTVSGLKMLVHQGALSFKIWTGMPPPLDVMYKAINDALG